MKRYVVIPIETARGAVEHVRVRVLAEAEGWLMVRRLRAMPFVIRASAIVAEIDP